MRIGLDIDGTITANPSFFSRLANEVLGQGGLVYVVTSRSAESEKETRRELEGYGVRFTSIHFIPSMSLAQPLCPHAELGWFEKYLWGKVAYALDSGCTHFVDDDAKVATLFVRYAPRIEFSEVDAEGLPKPKIVTSV